MANKNTEPAVVPEIEPAIVTEKEEMVTVRLPVIPNVDKQEAVYVGVNNRSWVIPRGKPMQVPKCVVEVLEHAEEESIAAMRYSMEKTV